MLSKSENTYHPSKPACNIFGQKERAREECAVFSQPASNPTEKEEEVLGVTWPVPWAVKVL